MKKIYLVGSLRNPKIPQIGKELRALGFDVFDDWYGAGPEADDYWQQYEKERGRSYAMALGGRAVENVASFDDKHLLDSDIVILIMPAGKSGHLELGISIGRGKLGFILFEEEPERWDAMYHLAIKYGGGVYFDLDTLKDRLRHELGKQSPESTAAPPKAKIQSLAKA